MFFAPAINIVSTAGAAYAGPGDVVAAAVGWWGLRAYTLASIGGNAVRLREDGGSTESNFVTIAGGGLDLAAIATFKGANNLFVVTLYDQTGNGRDLTQATTSVQPKFILAAFGVFPVIRWDGTATYTLGTASSLTQAQPWTSSLVAHRTNVSGGLQTVYGQDAGVPQFGFNSAANQAFLYAGNVVTATAADASWHAIQGVGNGAASDINVDGSVNTVNAGATGASGLPSLGGGAVGNPIGNGVDIVETGIWGSAFNGTQSSNMSTNQHAYWGF